MEERRLPPAGMAMPALTLTAQPLSRGVTATPLNTDQVITDFFVLTGERATRVRARFRQ
jgi:hypothetical protein